MWEYRPCVLHVLLFTRPLRHTAIYDSVHMEICTLCVRFYACLHISPSPASYALPHLPRMGRTTGPHRWGPGSDQQGHEGGWEKSHWHGQVLRSVHLAMYKVGLHPDTWAMAAWRSMSPLWPCLCHTDNLSCCDVATFCTCFVSRGSCRTPCKYFKWR